MTRLLCVVSIGLLMAACGIAAWLLFTGQAGTVDGLFLLCTCIVLGLAALLYLRFLIKSRTR